MGPAWAQVGSRRDPCQGSGGPVGLPDQFGPGVGSKRWFPTHLVDLWQPRHVSCEETIYVQNFKTAQIMGSARGAALSAAAIYDIPVFEYAPLRVKQAVVGFGRASKDQMSSTLAQMLGLPQALPFDQADALGLALCHALTWVPQ